ncbi:MAG: UDP-N-acetylmuramate dehydrogenase [Actinobacteria bacterium]|nr:UDP-N-acetylmuramate dehydrogenase [Actinomycetota bacterium]
MADSEHLRLAVAELREAMGAKATPDAPIARFTSFRLGGPAAVLCECETETDLETVSKVVSENDLPVLVLGKGTNLLVSDRGFPGVAIRLGKGFEWISHEEESILAAGGMAQLPRVANRAARLGLSGLEFAIAIPATVGGAVKMNAGAHGSSVSEVLDSATVFNFGGGSSATVGAADLDMSYRHTNLAQNDVVSSARFRLQPGVQEKIAGRMEEYRRHRSETQPVEAPNAGSMFRNPQGDSAGRLIEAAGLKELRVGKAEVSAKHANFFLARPGSTAQDVFDLMARVQIQVERASGVLLIPEVSTVGEFEGEEQLRG